MPEVSSMALRLMQPVLFNTTPPPRGRSIQPGYRKGKTQLTKWLVIFSQASKLNPFNALIFVAAATESTWNPFNILIFVSAATYEKRSPF